MKYSINLFTAGADGEVSKYFLSRFFKTEWQHARSICQSYGMELLTLESEAEQSHLLNSLEQHSAAFGTYEWINIGAMTTTCGSRDLWYWVDSGIIANFPILFGVPNPNCAGDNEMCLALGKYESGKFYIADTWCTEHPSRFLCKQKDIVFSG